MPTRATPLSAGWDIATNQYISIGPGQRRLCSTGIRLGIPACNYGRIAPRSGLASKYGINVGAGVIDSDYRGEIKVLLFNHSNKEFNAERGTKIAQIIFEQINPAPLLLVPSLNNTLRGENGFGSSDTHPPTSPVSLAGFSGVKN